MRPREIFGVGVRLLAVWFWTEAAFWGYWAAVKSLGTDLGNPAISAREDIGYVILYGILGIALMSGARLIVWIAYGDAPKQAKGNTGTDETPILTD